MSIALHPIDAAVVAAYLVVVIGLGVWIGRGNRTPADYFLGGRDLPWWALLGSIVATETSTATFLSVPGVAFNGDMRFLQLAFGLILGRMLVAAVLLPQYFRGRLDTAYELLGQRFGGATKPVASVLFLVARNLGDGLRLFLAALVVENVTGLPLSACALAVGGLTIVYTVLGGIKSVVWNDCVQLVIYLAGGVAIAVMLGQLVPGGWEQIVKYGQGHDKFRLFVFDLDLTQPFTIWSGVIVGSFLTLGTHGTDQMMVQRYLAARSQRDAARAVVLSGWVVLAQFALFLLIGVALAAFYAADPASVPFARGDAVMPAFVVHHLPPGLVGLLLAAIFAAAMSTLSSSLISSARSAVSDLYCPWRNIPTDDPRLVPLSRALTVAFGLVQVGVGIAAENVSASVVESALAIAGFVAGILLGVFALGVLTSRVGWRAALVGMLAGLIAESWLQFGTPVAWTWLAVAGSLTTFLTGLFASFVLVEKPNSDESTGERGA
jgi:SSS family transporter